MEYLCILLNVLVPLFVYELHVLRCLVNEDIHCRLEKFYWLLLVPQRSLLPASGMSYHSPVLAILAGLEPATGGLTVHCSTIKAIESLFGGAAWIRTRAWYAWFTVRCVRPLRHIPLNFIYQYSIIKVFRSKDLFYFLFGASRRIRTSSILIKSQMPYPV